jgi:hypothetical protein
MQNRRILIVVTIFDDTARHFVLYIHATKLAPCLELSTSEMLACPLLTLQLNETFQAQLTDATDEGDPGHQCSKSQVCLPFALRVWSMSYLTKSRRPDFRAQVVVFATSIPLAIPRRRSAVSDYA